VAQLNVTTGNVNWINQMGTSENERMAHGGGITVDPLTGNAIVLAQTEGIEPDFELLHPLTPPDNAGAPKDRDCLL
jgi:hypothetical protein